jgi:hypothetical protein
MALFFPAKSISILSGTANLSLPNEQSSQISLPPSQLPHPQQQPRLRLPHDNQNFPSNIKETHIMILIKSHPKQINHQPKARPPINKKKSKFPKKIKKENESKSLTRTRDPPVGNRARHGRARVRGRRLSTLRHQTCMHQVVRSE